MKHILSLLLLCFALCHEAHASSPQYLALSDSADNLIKKERWKDAEAVILSALRLEPGNFANSLLLSNLGVVRTNMGKTEEALEDFRLAVSIAPKSSAIRNNRAATLISAGDLDGAIENLDVSLSIDSMQAWPLVMRANIMLSRKETEAARTDFNRVLRFSPRNASAFAGLARVEECEGNIKEALEHYDKAIDISDDPETRFSRILLKIRAAKYSEAAEDISKSMEKYPHSPDLFIARSLLHRLNFRNEESEIDKKIALDKGADPQLVESLLPEIGK